MIGTQEGRQETVDYVLADVEASRMLTPDPGTTDLQDLLADRHPGVVTYDGWQRIDTHERSLGEPRDGAVKLDRGRGDAPDRRRRRRLKARATERISAG